MQNVTSRGCSRIYILCVLWRGLAHVKRLRAEGKSVVFPFDSSAIDEWIVAAKDDCSKSLLGALLGCNDFNASDSSTYWNSATHFLTW